jgi:hypothetical protein
VKVDSGRIVGNPYLIALRQSCPSGAWALLVPIWYIFGGNQSHQPTHFVPIQREDYGTTRA